MTKIIPIVSTLLCAGMFLSCKTRDYNTSEVKRVASSNPPDAFVSEYLALPGKSFSKMSPVVFKDGPTILAVQTSKDGMIYVYDPLKKTPGPFSWTLNVCAESRCFFGQPVVLERKGAPSLFLMDRDGSYHFVDMVKRQVVQSSKLNFRIKSDEFFQIEQVKRLNKTYLLAISDTTLAKIDIDTGLPVQQVSVYPGQFNKFQGMLTYESGGKQVVLTAQENSSPARYMIYDFDNLLTKPVKSGTTERGAFPAIIKNSGTPAFLSNEGEKLALRDFKTHSVLKKYKYSNLIDGRNRFDGSTLAFVHKGRETFAAFAGLEGKNEDGPYFLGSVSVFDATTGDLVYMVEDDGTRRFHVHQIGGVDYLSVARETSDVPTYGRRFEIHSITDAKQIVAVSFYDALLAAPMTLFEANGGVYATGNTENSLVTVKVK